MSVSSLVSLLDDDDLVIMIIMIIVSLVVVLVAELIGQPLLPGVSVVAVVVASVVGVLRLDVDGLHNLGLLVSVVVVGAGTNVLVLLAAGLLEVPMLRVMLVRLLDDNMLLLAAVLMIMMMMMVSGMVLVLMVLVLLVVLYNDHDEVLLIMLLFLMPAELVEELAGQDGLGVINWNERELK